MTAVEVNFDGLIGPTHHYGGLSPGNIASQSHRWQTSRPRQAALQGLVKMKLLSDLGIPQGVLPPHPRPDLEFLRGSGFTGTDEDVLMQAAQRRPELLSIACSASSMWAANAATVSPSADTADGRIHFTPANLISTPHRRLEPPFTTRLLRAIFADDRQFAVHDPLPGVTEYADEGAANHLRLCPGHGDAGLEIFVYGRTEESEGPELLRPRIHPARQTRLAGETIAALHGLRADAVMFVQQNPEAIDAGVFHNDVIAVANENLLMCHALAFVDQPRVLAEARERLPSLQVFEVSAAELSLEEAVATYLFNSQLVTLPDSRMLLLCPIECELHPGVQKVLGRLRREVERVRDVRYVDVRQSMRNGGGPACLRLRAVLTERELASLPKSILITDSLHRQLTGWVTRHYREELTPADLGAPAFLQEVRAALEELSEILDLEISWWDQDRS